MDPTGRDDANEADELVLAYLTCPKDPSNNFLGAVLITDARSRPLHFGFVTPVRPTTMQRLLYGSTLAEHVRVDVITRKLWSDGIPVIPDVVFVDDQAMLAARRTVGIPTAHLTRETGPALATNLSTIRYFTGDNRDDEQAVGQIVAMLDGTIDLLDPFRRIGDALKEALKAKDGNAVAR